MIKSHVMRLIGIVPPIMAVTVLTIAGCGKKSPPVSIFPLVNKEEIQVGGKLYKSRCALCHGTPEMGNLPTFAPLANSAVVKGDPLPFASAILYHEGHETKPGEPHFFEAMGDAEISHIGNYLKSTAHAVDNPMRAKTVEKAREIHKVEEQMRELRAKTPESPNDDLPEPDDTVLPN